MPTDTPFRPAALCLVALALSLCSCAQDVAQPPAASSSKPNILLITVDDLRKDRLQTYGFAGETSPELLRFSEGAAVFEDLQTNTTIGLSSYATLMTGRSVAGHGCVDRNAVLAPQATTLAESLLSIGYDTHAVVTCDSLGRQHGLHQGFVNFDDELIRPESIALNESTSKEVSRRALAFLKAKMKVAAAGSDQPPWFLWLHYQDPRPTHFYYDLAQNMGEIVRPPKGTKPDERYRSEVKFTDLHVGRVLQGVDQAGFGDETVIVVVGAHGDEALGLGPKAVLPTPAQEFRPLPLMMRAPGGQGSRIQPMVRTMDLAPTLVDFAGGGALGEEFMEGQSLRPILTRSGPWTSRPGLVEEKRHPSAEVLGVVTGTHRLHVHRKTGEHRLYERAPGGEVLAREQGGELLSSLQQTLATLQQEAGREPGPATQGPALLDGIVELQYASGKIWSRGELSHGVPHGLWKTWYPDGKNKSSQKYVDGVLHGDTMAWLPSGALRFRGAYKKGLPDGSWKFWYGKNKRRAEMKYVEGSRRGSWIYWNESELPVIELAYTKQGRHLQVRENYPDSTQAVTGAFVDGVREGKWRTWHRGGGLKRYWPYEGGVLHGKSFAYDPGGFVIEDLCGEFDHGVPVVDAPQSD